jgi:hypothetical protein
MHSRVGFSIEGFFNPPAAYEPGVIAVDLADPKRG